MMYVEQLLPSCREQLAMISGTAPLVEAAKIFHSRTIGLVVVCTPDGLMAGIVTKTDIVRQISTCQGTSCTIMVSSVMTRDVAFCHPDVLVREAWLSMQERRLKHIPIADRTMRPIGVLTARQAVQALLSEVECEEELLKDYVEGIGYR